MNRLRHFKLLAWIIVCILFSGTASTTLGQRQARRKHRLITQRRTAAPLTAAQRRRDATFTMVWETINNQYFDSTFGGLDWNRVRAKYEPLAKQARTDAELYILLQTMLDELHQSHLSIIPPEFIPRFVKNKRRHNPAKDDGSPEAADDAQVDDGSEDDPKETEGNLELTTRMSNGIGIDLRLMDGNVVITRVAENGPAAKAGLKPGFIINKIDEIDIEQRIKAVSDAHKNSPYINLTLRQGILVYLLGGEPDSDVSIIFTDGDNQEHKAVIKRGRLEGQISRPVGNFPPMYTEFESKRIANGVGYIRFGTFSPEWMEKICGALSSMNDAPGLILDLRGNPGGIMGMSAGIGGLLSTDAGIVGTLITREGQLPVPLFPQRHPYTGPVVVLIDSLSGSSAEVLAASMQESGRATIIGEQSAGVVQGADTVKLPTGAVLEFARMGFKTAKGTALEGKGVRPDIEKKLDRPTLLKGEDCVIAEAIKRIETLKAQAVSIEPPPPPPVSKPLTSLLMSVVSSVTPKSAPPPPPPPAASTPVEPSAPQTFQSTPMAEAIMERFLKAAGGREDLKAVKTRVSRGSSAMATQGLTGKVVIYEEAPNRRSMETDTPGLGVTQLAMDGKRAWLEDPLTGLLEFKGTALKALQNYYNLYKIPDYKTHFVKMEFVGLMADDGGPVNVLVLTTHEGIREEMHFNEASGMLVYDDGASFDDYRQVGEVKLPFKISVSIAGIKLITTLDKIELNAEIKPEVFREHPSCFSQR
jgi:carboxyl-terminal processing protease